MPGGAGTGAGWEGDLARECTPNSRKPPSMLVLGPRRGARVHFTPNAHSPSHGATTNSSSARKRQRKKTDRRAREQARARKEGTTPAPNITYLEFLNVQVC